MKNTAHNRQMEDASRWEKFAALEQDVSGLKQDIAGLDGRISHMGEKLDVSLSRLFDKVEAGNRRQTPWNIIFSFAGIFATVVLALAAWANAYFGQAIGAAQREAAQSMAAHAGIQTQINTMRAEITSAAIDAARWQERLSALTSTIDSGRKKPHHGK